MKSEFNTYYILLTGAKRPEDIFGNAKSAEEIHDIYKKISKIIHPGRKDTISLIDFVLNTSDNSRIIRVDADCSNAKCVCCKDKGVLKNVYNQIGHYNTYDRNKK
jgi:hypothetical protein